MKALPFGNESLQDRTDSFRLCKMGVGCFLIGLLSYLTNGQVFEKYRGATFGGEEGFVKIKVGLSLDKRTPGRKMISMSAGPFKFTKDFITSPGFQEHVQIIAAEMRLTMLACNPQNIDSRLVKYAFGGTVKPELVVDFFAPSDVGLDKMGSVETPGYYFFDDDDVKYVGPFKEKLEALGAAGENIRQRVNRLNALTA